MTFHVERISDEDKKKYEINMTGSWAIDPQTGAVFFYKRGFASGHIKVYDLVHDGVKVRVSAAPKRYSPDERIYNGTFNIQRILFPETHKDRLPFYKDLISSALKKLGFFLGIQMLLGILRFYGRIGLNIAPLTKSHSSGGYNLDNYPAGISGSDCHPYRFISHMTPTKWVMLPSAS